MFFVSGRYSSLVRLFSGFIVLCDLSEQLLSLPVPQSFKKQEGRERLNVYTSPASLLGQIRLRTKSSVANSA